jgi:two-component system alkaline phosphatase synthesis response regulator PhoP
MSNEEYRVLLVDDEPDVLEFLGYNLKREGYQIFTAGNGLEAIEVANRVHPHLVILDVMMPKMDGMEVCREIKLKPELANTIVIFLTARGEDYSQVAGFDAGADDYITKPIQPRVLVSRVKALLRRYKKDDTYPEKLFVGNLLIDRERFKVIRDDREIVLPKKEFELLMALASKPNKVFSREEIFAKVWGSDVIVGERTIDVHVRKIREKIGLDNIKTIKGVGYKFEVET